MARCMRSVGRLLVSVFLLAAGSAGVAQQKVFRCGPDGRTYSQTPCNDGREVDVADPRTTEQRKAAEDAAKREGKTVEKMTRERQAKEAAAAKQRAGQVATPSVPEPAASVVAGADTKKKRPVNGSGKPAAPARPIQH